MVSSQDKIIHFVGLKGVGMTALACMAQDQNWQVTGSDLGEEYLTDRIIKRRQFKLYTGFDQKHIESARIVVFSASHGGLANPEVKTALALGKKVLTQTELLVEYCRGKRVVAIAGVGGKSTTAAMLATILHKSGLNPSYYVGVADISPLGDPGYFSGKSKLVVVEADEYFDPKYHRAKFLLLRPQGLILTNVVFDHPDVYTSPDQTSSVFRQLIARQPTSGWLVINNDCPANRSLMTTKKIDISTVGYGQDSLWPITERHLKNGIQSFNLKNHGRSLNCQLSLPGSYNVVNAALAAVGAKKLGVANDQIVKGLRIFGGTKRRLEIIYKSPKHILYDDYAHHPLELQAMIKAIGELYPSRPVVIVFQPHTYSRTKALLEDFSRSFKQCTYCLITDIFASAREKDDQTISGPIVADKINSVSHNAFWCSGKKEVISWLKAHRAASSVVVTAGAGDLFHWHSDIIKILNHED
jgi:UDP-N-acetylmuramate--alanine ligase